jgi:hypothetical protein
MIETPIWDDLPGQKRREMFENTATQLPARKIDQPDDIAEAVLFLIQKGSRLPASFKSVEVPIVKGLPAVSVHTNPGILSMIRQVAQSVQRVSQRVAASKALIKHCAHS